ncbi:MAG TPA: fumarylacetoacetate hydrolase [Verrucomicrobiales bacterium]|nr:fumarylacetoacetate hydrolase [Verrucomicrobiales bacterium]
MKLCRYLNSYSELRLGLIHDDKTVADIGSAEHGRMTSLLESENLGARLKELSNQTLMATPLQNVRLLAPVEKQEVWAAGVTYLRSKTARMAESDFSAQAYDKVYEADRPELFFKSVPEKVVANGEAVGIRRDAKWNVPEPELALVLNSHGKIVGYTIGNDMSSRDIEGENLLYLPQAKVYDRCCALGPWINVGALEVEAAAWKIKLTIHRGGKAVFDGETSVSQMKRKLSDLADWLFRSQTFPNGAILLTGTGLVPGDDFTLQADDRVRIEISGIGVLENHVVVV